MVLDKFLFYRFGKREYDFMDLGEKQCNIVAFRWNYDFGVLVKICFLVLVKNNHLVNLVKNMILKFWRKM